MNMNAPAISTATLRRLSAAHDVDPRSILRELREPGSVRGMAGERARRAVIAYQSREQPVAAAKAAVVR
ncbi:MAG TPA: hypothetical protein VIX35_05750 [Vicinamibacterales bacterium]